MMKRSCAAVIVSCKNGPKSSLDGTSRDVESDQGFSINTLSSETIGKGGRVGCVISRNGKDGSMIQKVNHIDQYTRFQYRVVQSQGVGRGRRTDITSCRDEQEGGWV